jgi:hypothetical protein
MGVDAHYLPMAPDGDDWLARFNDALVARTGLRLIRVHDDDMPPPTRWIAVGETGDPESTHALVCHRNTLVYDPSSHYTTLPLERVVFGLVVVS